MPADTVVLPEPRRKAPSEPAAAPPERDGLPPPQRLWANITIWLAIVLAVMDSSIANVALPSIARSVHATPSSSIWVVNAYQLSITICLLPLASLGEIVGYARVYRVGLAVFTAASLCCALSSGLVSLSLARVLQGVGAAGIMSVNGALVRFVYPQRLFARGLSLNAMVVSISAAAGPTVAAGILAVAPWPWLFAINVPVGAAAFVIAIRSLPRTPLASHRFDVPSAALNAVFLGLLIVGLDDVAHGEGRTIAIASFVASALAGTILVRRQLNLAAPLLPIDLLRIPIFALSCATSICSFLAQALAFVALPFFLQRDLGVGVVATGLLMTPWPLAVAVISPVSGRLCERVPAALLGFLGLIMLAIGLAAVGTLPHAAGAPAVAWRMALCGLGFGLFQTPNNRTLIGSAPRTRSGGASGMLATSRLLGQTIGASLVALIFALASNGGSRDAVLTAAGVSLVAALVSLARTGKARGFAP